MLATLCSFGSALALADGPSTGAQSPPQNLSALWPMFGVLVATFAGWLIPKLSAEYTFFHTGWGAVVLGVLGAIIGGVGSVLQAGTVTWAALAWAAISAATSFFARLNPSTTKDEPPAKSPAARGGLAAALPLFLALAALSGCATAGGQALGKCELGQLVAQNQTVAVDVTAIAVAGGANWQQELGSLGASLLPGQLECAITAIVASWSSSHGALTPERAAALQRLNQYLAAHPAKACIAPHRS
jgi:hypothetical protein